MESKKGIWLNTMNDGVLLFKNVSLSVKESDKEDKKDEDAIEHSADNQVLKFDEDEVLYPHGSKYFHNEMQVFCTVTDRTENEVDGVSKLESIKVRLDSLDSEAVLPNDESLTNILKKELDVFIRVVHTSGDKLTIQGTFNLNVNFKENMKTVFASVGYNSGKFKLFHNQKLLDNNTEFSTIFQPGQDTYIYAFESMGKPKMWKRFPKCYEYGTWSCGGSADAISFTPTKPITLAGFQFYVPKEENECEMNYKITIGENHVEEGPTKTYTDWEDTYFKTVYLENTYSVQAEQRINILVRIAKNLANSNYTNTYYGTDGYDWASIPNEHMGLFKVSYGTDCCNGTSESSGQIPSILYYLD